MTAAKNLGIWMDHSQAHLLECSTVLIATTVIVSKFKQHTQAPCLTKNEALSQQSDYYKEVGEAIKNYEDVILFGPTDAKIELLMLLIDNKCLANLKIRIKYTDKMTENQQETFVKDYFSLLS